MPLDCERAGPFALRATAFQDLKSEMRFSDGQIVTAFVFTRRRSCSDKRSDF